MARVSMAVVRKKAGSACDREPNPRSCRKGVALAIEAYRSERGKKRKANPAAARRLNAWRRCAEKAGVAPFTKPTAEQKRKIDACLGR